MNDFENNWFVRDNIELDEKLPVLAQEVIRRGIDYRQLDKNEVADENVVIGIIEVMRDILCSFHDMTGDEIECAIETIQIACEITRSVRDGSFEEEENGIMLSSSFEDILERN